MTGRPPTDLDSLRKVARAGRAALRRLWERRDERDRLAPPERRLLELLELHAEYRPFWEGAEPDAGENPFLHVTMHDLVERQLAEGDPPEARAALARLLERGCDRHEALHEIMRLFARELAAMAEARGRFERDRYRAALDRLARGARGDGEETR